MPVWVYTSGGADEVLVMGRWERCYGHFGNLDVGRVAGEVYEDYEYGWQMEALEGRKDDDSPFLVARIS